MIENPIRGLDLNIDHKYSKLILHCLLSKVCITSMGTGVYFNGYNTVLKYLSVEHRYYIVVHSHKKITKVVCFNKATWLNCSYKSTFSPHQVHRLTSL